MSVTIGGFDCNISCIYSGNIINIDVSSCVSNLSSGVNDIVIITNSGILTKTKYFENFENLELVEGSDGEIILVFNNLLITSGTDNSFSLGHSNDYVYGVTVYSSGNIYVIGEYF